MAPTNATCQGTTGSITVTITGGESPYTCSTDGGAFSVCASGDVIPNLGAGSHSITVKDANTCQDTASATIGQQSCGKIAPTNTTCSQFTGGTAGDITQLCFGLKQGKINNVAPGVFFYFSKITSDVSGTLTIDIVQTNSPSFPYFDVQQNSQVTLYNASCGNLLNPAAITINNGQVHIVVSNVTIGQVIIVQVKYSANSIVGTSANKNTAIHYGFATNVNGVQKDADPDGLNLINCVGGSTAAATPQIGAQGPEAAPGSSDLEPYRPSPNPFAETMRMAYAVAGVGERVDIGVYDLVGRRISTLESGFQSAGRHVATWDGRGSDGTRLKNGIYFIRTIVGDRLRTVRVAILR